MPNEYGVYEHPEGQRIGHSTRAASLEIETAEVRPGEWRHALHLELRSGIWLGVMYGMADDGPAARDRREAIAQAVAAVRRALAGVPAPKGAAEKTVKMVESWCVCLLEPPDEQLDLFA